MSNSRTFPGPVGTMFGGAPLWVVCVFRCVDVVCLLCSDCILSHVVCDVWVGSSVFSGVFATTERSQMGLFMSLFGFGIGMMIASFHV